MNRRLFVLLLVTVSTVVLLVDPWSSSQVGAVDIARTASVTGAEQGGKQGGEQGRRQDGERGGQQGVTGVRPGGASTARSWPVGPPRPLVVRGWEPPASPYGPGHRGVDLSAAPGTVVRAAAAGRIAFAGRVAGRGVLSISLTEAVSTDTPLRTTYEPVDALLPMGAEVSAGQPVGRVASGGSHCRTGCLHWGLRRGPQYLDPLSLLPPQLLGHAGPRLLPVIGTPPLGAEVPLPAQFTRPRRDSSLLSPGALVLSGTALALYGVLCRLSRRRPTRGRRHRDQGARERRGHRSRFRPIGSWSPSHHGGPAVAEISYGYPGTDGTCSRTSRALSDTASSALARLSSGRRQVGLSRNSTGQVRSGQVRSGQVRSENNQVWTPRRAMETAAFAMTSGSSATPNSMRRTAASTTP
ncbi:peptidoglycan DD-metalloendopeptidase family protein [Streptomyces sp. NPDC056500]|uniref:peptidoglycan DD-metalloendopeptidase family protein n=1 Tax=Streptomyces sp. NPDC056500 TaxID=3345840 RepID=UPI00369FF0A3